ncbi:MAG: SDR family oxidoreductase [Verrucomicrobiales bacterium]|nr:SDR family oxidoreductase [Verrucomicrobiales bacterium]
MARCLAEAGARVFLVGRREAVLREASEGIGASAGYAVHDVTAFDRAGELVEKVERLAEAPVSILINNAGNHLKKPAEETTPEEFQTILDTHVLAAHALTRAVLPGMLARGHGSILFTASMSSLLGIPYVVAYSAAKSAYLGMVRSLAVEVSGRGVRVNGIAPGWIESDILRRAVMADPERKARILARTPMGGFGLPEDIGHAAVFLCSPAARFITGVVLPVDGGASIGF